MSAPKRSGWDLIEDPLIDVESTLDVFDLIGELTLSMFNDAKASAFETMTRHLRSDFKALQKGFRDAHDKYELKPRQKPKGGDVVAFADRATVADGDAA